jgi:hypothetical protein
MVTRYIGSGRQREGGFAATHRHDFAAHTEGGDFRHTADQTDMNPSITVDNNIFNSPTVQGTLEDITAFLNTIGQGFVSIGDGYDINHADFVVGSIPTPSLESAFVAAFNHPRLVNGGVILVKTGKYFITSTVTVPPGYLIMGELGGTIIKGETANQPMFLIKRATDRPALNGSAFLSTSPINKTAFVNIVLADNLDGYVASGGPSMTTVPMVQFETGCHFTCHEVSFFGRMGVLGAAAAYGRSKTLYALASTTGDSNETSVTLDNCTIDGVQNVMSYFANGTQDKLVVNQCNVRAFGTELAADSANPLLNSYFITSNSLRVTITNNYFDPAPQDGVTGQSYIQTLLTYSSGSPNIVIKGNIGSTHPSGLASFNNNIQNAFVLGFFAGASTLISISNNTWNNDKTHLTSVKLGTPTDRILISQTIGLLGQIAVREYMTGDGSHMMTTNAYWDGANWNKDDTAQKSTLKLTGNFNGSSPLEVEAVHDVGAGSWADGAWDRSIKIVNTTVNPTGSAIGNNRIYSNGIIQLASPTSGVQSAADSNLNKDTLPINNTLYAKTLIKSWGHVTINMTTFGISYSDGFNANSASFAASGTSFTIAFQTPMTNANYAVLITERGNNPGIALIPRCSARTTSSFDVQMYDAIGAAFHDFAVSGTTVAFSWMVLAEQT